MSTKQLEGQTIIVTGAANGMGVTHAKMFAEHGARIVANDLSPKVQNTVDAIIAAGGEAVASVHDVTDYAQAEAIVRTGLDSFGSIDGIVHNAAINLGLSFADTTLESFDKTLKVNAYGVFYLSKAAWPTFVEQKHGRLVFIGAASTLLPPDNMASYNASKSIAAALSNTIAREGAAYGITSNVVFPAAITEMSSAMMDEETMRALSPKLRAEWVSPVVGWLLRRDNTVTGKTLLASSSRAHEVFPAWTKGYQSPDLQIEDLVANEAAVFDPADAAQLANIEEFMAFILR